MWPLLFALSFIFFPVGPIIVGFMWYADDDNEKEPTPAEEAIQLQLEEIQRKKDDEIIRKAELIQAKRVLEEESKEVIEHGS